MRQVTTPVTGGCLRGQVRYAAEVFLQNGYICHCTICQRSTGQPAEITVLIRAGTLRYTKGEPKYYRSSPEGKRGFCTDCGARIVWQAEKAEDDWLTNLTVGSLDDRQAARVTKHICADTQLGWYRLAKDLPKFGADEADRLIEALRAELCPNHWPNPE